MPLCPLTRAEQNQRDLEALRISIDPRERQRLRNQLVRNNLPLVYAVTSRMACRLRLPPEDLQQIGSLGLLRAIEAFQPSRGRSLSSFAVPYIRGAIQHELRDRYSLIRIPRDLWDLRRRAASLQETRQRQGQATLAPRALAAALGCDPVRLLEALQLGAVMEMRSLDAPLGEDGSADGVHRTLLENVPDPNSLAGLVPEEILPLGLQPVPHPAALPCDAAARAGATREPSAGSEPHPATPYGKAAPQTPMLGSRPTDQQGPAGQPELSTLEPSSAPHRAMVMASPSGHDTEPGTTAPATTPEQSWLRQHLAALEPLQRELVLGHVCCGLSWAALGRDLGLHPRQAQRLTTALLLRLQQEGQRWRTGSSEARAGTAS